MTKMNEEQDYQRLDNQISQIITRLEKIESQLEKVIDFSDRIEKIEDNLLLVADINRYAQLRDYLAAGRWFDADIETINIIMAISGHSKLEELKPTDIEIFPGNALRVIDNLWLKYSEGKFGFSVQLKIYKSVGGHLEATIAQDQDFVDKWGEKVGWRVNKKWRKCEDLDFSLNAPTGCHPSQWWNSPYGSKMTNYFLARLMRCGF